MESLSLNKGVVTSLVPVKRLAPQEEPLVLLSLAVVDVDGWLEFQELA